MKTNEITQAKLEILKTLKAGNSVAHFAAKDLKEMHRDGLIEWALMTSGFGWSISATGLCKI